MQIATALAHSNIAFIKYWGNRDDALRLPVNGSISMNLDGLDTVTTVRFDPTLDADRFALDGAWETGPKRERVSTQLNLLRGLAGVDTRAEVLSENNFPQGTGIASSASAFSALTLAAAAALGLELSEAALSRLARRGSGSAARSSPGGFIEWYLGDGEENSYAESFAPPDHWDLVDLVAIVSREHKAVGSTGGHPLAPTSPLQQARIADTPRRLDMCRTAILERDFGTFASVIEHDTLVMHSVMMTSEPSLMYWEPDTLRIMQQVRLWRDEGLPAAFTIDAGPNVHVMALAPHSAELQARLAALPGVESVRHASAGGPARLLTEHLTPPRSA